MRASSFAQPALLMLALSLWASDVFAQDGGPASRIRWLSGPGKGRIGNVAEIGIPANCRFTDKEGTKLFMEATENPSSESELALMYCRSTVTDSTHWFVVFSYDRAGYVKDDEKNSLDAPEILKSLKEGTASGNEERRRRGWEELELIGWERQPYYDVKTHNLTWSTRIRSLVASDTSINHSVRLLGRGGVMNADLVANPDEFTSAVSDFDLMLSQYDYLPGQRYSEWRSGDEVAEYGLTALIAGGAGVAAGKLGLFGKAWKLILGVVLALKKLVIVAVVAVGAFLKRLFGKKDAPPASQV